MLAWALLLWYLCSLAPVVSARLPRCLGGCRVFFCRRSSFSSGTTLTDSIYTIAIIRRESMYHNYLSLPLNPAIGFWYGTTPYCGDPKWTAFTAYAMVNCWDLAGRVLRYDFLSTGWIRDPRKPVFYGTCTWWGRAATHGWMESLHSANWFAKSSGPLVRIRISWRS